MSAIEEFVAASEKGDVQKMSALLPNIDVNVANSEGWTALLKAAFVGQLEAAQWLVKSAGADVDRANADERTLLYFACGLGEKDVAQFLLDAGADVDKVDKDGDTALHVACFEDHEEAAQALIRAGADVNKANKEGFVPLDYARGNATLAKLLLDADAVGTFNGKPACANSSPSKLRKRQP